MAKGAIMKSWVRGRAFFSTSALIALSYFGLGLPAFAAEPTYQYDIPAESLGQALSDYSQASSQQIIFSNETVAGRKSAGLHGRYTSAQALDALLAGTDLKAKTNTAGVLMVQSKNVQAAQDEPAAAISNSATEIETVVVTGTNIRNAQPVGASVTVLNRDDIERSGLSSLPDVMRTLPQNFEGGSNPGMSVTGTHDAQINTTQGSGINLRGLGADSTLVLIDGKRSALAGSGTFVDISSIPLSAIDRVEVLNDGASAIYGSDAVGGVVNIIMRKDFDGAESNVRYGGATDGGLDEFEFSQVFGKSWNDGSLILDYDHRDRTGLPASDRGYSATAAPEDLLPSENHNTIYGSAQQRINDTISADATVSYATSTSFQDEAPAVNNEVYLTSATKVFNAAGHVSVDLPNDWQLNLTPFYSQLWSAYNLQLKSGPDAGRKDDTVAEFDGKADGKLIALPGGDVRLAVGGSYRREAYQSVSSSSPIRPAREVWAGFGEIRIPLVGSANAFPGIQQLVVSAAGRVEHYSDFGDTANPRIGVDWKPFDDVTLRGSYGTSFKAPNFNDMYGAIPFTFLYNPNVYGYPDPGSPSGNSDILYVGGPNPNLNPETARNWTVGIDWRPAAFEGLAVTATYSDINFKDRITTATTGYFDPFTNPTVFGGLLNRNPTLAEINQLLTIPTFINVLGPFSPSQINAIFDDRIRNLSDLEYRGLDFHVAQAFVLSEVKLNTGVDGSYIFDFRNQLTSTAAPFNFAGYLFNPGKIKARAFIESSYGSLSGSLFVNYTDGEINQEITPVQHVSSWTTVDATLRYKFEGADALNGTSLSLSASNLFDEAPPHVITTPAVYTNPVGFDPTQANPNGRVVSLQLTKRW